MAAASSSPNHGIQTRSKTRAAASRSDPSTDVKMSVDPTAQSATATAGESRSETTAASASASTPETVDLERCAKTLGLLQSFPDIGVIDISQMMKYPEETKALKEVERHWSATISIGSPERRFSYIAYDGPFTGLAYTVRQYLPRKLKIRLVRIDPVYHGLSGLSQSADFTAWDPELDSADPAVVASYYHTTAFLVERNICMDRRVDSLEKTQTRIIETTTELANNVKVILDHLNALPRAP
jgi:hypothetical protein